VGICFLASVCSGAMGFGVVPWVTAAGAAGAAACVVAGLCAAGTSRHTSITIWGAAPAAALPSALYGGASYGAATLPTGAMIVEHRAVEVAAAGDVRISGVSASLDAGSVQLRSITEIGGFTVDEQRFIPGATTPDEILARHVGEQVTVITPKADVTGVLRSVDAQALVLEVGTGARRQLQVMRRDGYVQEVRLSATVGNDQPSLVWRVTTKQPGTHEVEFSYRTEGLTWSADYLAILDEAQQTLDFSAWATVKNGTTATFENADLTLVDAAPGGGGAPLVTRPAAAPTRFVVPNAVRLGTGESVQVELFTPRKHAKTRAVVMFEAMPDPSPSFQQFQAVDCTQFATSAGTSRAELAFEVDVPTKSSLPEGRVRMYKRAAPGLEVVTEGALQSVAGVARVPLDKADQIEGERHAVSCNYDERGHLIREKIELKLENKGTRGLEVIAREFMWRWPMFKLEDETPRGSRVAPQTQEYRISMPAGSTRSITYTVVYSW
jgi:hypothetical protein